MQAAQYAHLPLSTIGSDWIIDAADALYARQLREWPSPLPGQPAPGARTVPGWACAARACSRSFAQPPTKLHAGPRSVCPPLGHSTPVLRCPGRLPRGSMGRKTCSSCQAFLLSPLQAEVPTLLRLPPSLAPGIDTPLAIQDTLNPTPCAFSSKPQPRHPLPPSLPPAGEAGHLLWVRDPTQPDLASEPTDQAEALTLREQQQQLEVRRATGSCGRPSKCGSPLRIRAAPAPWLAGPAETSQMLKPARRRPRRVSFPGALPPRIHSRPPPPAHPPPTPTHPHPPCLPPPTPTHPPGLLPRRLPLRVRGAAGVAPGGVCRAGGGRPGGAGRVCSERRPARLRRGLPVRGRGKRGGGGGLGCAAAFLCKAGEREGGPGLASGASRQVARGRPAREGWPAGGQGAPSMARRASTSRQAPPTHPPPKKESPATCRRSNACLLACRVLKNLAQSWMDDASKRSNMWVVRAAQGCPRAQVPACQARGPAQPHTGSGNSPPSQLRSKTLNVGPPPSMQCRCLAPLRCTSHTRPAVPLPCPVLQLCGCSAAEPVPLDQLPGVPPARSGPQTSECLPGCSI